MISALVDATDVAAPSLADRVDDVLAELPPDVPAALWEKVLLAPTRDVLARPGKQLRGALVEVGWRLGGGHATHTPPAELAAAIEILHAGSLVIDDIEDDAELRRGEPALHRRYGTALAINTGNWMYFWAFTLLDRAPLGAVTRAHLTRAMLGATMACHAGQALDLGTDVTRIARDRLRTIVERSTTLKSGSLVALALQLGAIAAGASPDRLAAITEFGSAFGLGLQMLDDLGTVTSATRIAQKSREDLLNLRLTWAWVWASERADDASWRRLQVGARMLAEARDDHAPLAHALGELAGHGKGEIHTRLTDALDKLRAIADATTLAIVEGELRRLEASYG